MLTRFVRMQLVIFTIASIIGMLVLLFAYVQLPTLLGIGRVTVTLELPGTGGLYRFANVTYRGAQVGKVTHVRPTAAGAVAILSLDRAPQIPVDLQAQVRSVSALGEQYVDLLPRTDSGPYLRDGSIIPMHDATIPQAIGPVLDQVSALVDSIPKNKLGNLLDETFTAFNGAGYDIKTLVDSTAKLAADIDAQGDRPRRLVDDSVPLLDSQVMSADSIRTWARSFAGITSQLVTNDPQLRDLLRAAPPSADEVTRLLEQVKPTLPLLLQNLTTVGQVALTYNPALRQVLVLLPPTVASLQSVIGSKNPEGMLMGDAALQVEPPPCLVGFLPPSQWRTPADTTTLDTPDGLYCKLPQDSPLAVRGARNLPCMEKPGKRAPTVELCASDQPYEPLAMRQHALGPMPIDPNLLAQGIPPDDRVDSNERLYAPPEGTPMPLQSPAPTAPPPADAPDPPDPAGPLPVEPSAFTEGQFGQPSLSAAQYDPHTGAYTSNGQLYQQTNIAPSKTTGKPATWQDLFPK